MYIYNIYYKYIYIYIYIFIYIYINTNKKISINELMIRIITKAKLTLETLSDLFLSSCYGHQFLIN